MSNLDLAYEVKSVVDKYIWNQASEHVQTGLKKYLNNTLEKSRNAALYPTECAASTLGSFEISWANLRKYSSYKGEFCAVWFVNINRGYAFTREQLKLLDSNFDLHADNIEVDYIGYYDDGEIYVFSENIIDNLSYVFDHTVFYSDERGYYMHHKAY